MASFTPAGTPNTSHIVFNSGTLDFGAQRLVMLDNIAMNIEWTTAPLYVLGSIKAQNLARHSQKVSLTGKLKSFSPSLWAAGAGSSGGSAPITIATLDGQPALLAPVGTFFDSAGNEVQYQFVNALFKSMKSSLKMEDYAEFDFELEATDVVIVSQASV